MWGTSGDVYFWPAYKAGSHHYFLLKSWLWHNSNLNLNPSTYWRPYIQTSLEIRVEWLIYQVPPSLFGLLPASARKWKLKWTEEGRGRERERQKQEEKNDISILRPVLPVSGLISQCLWGAECNQSALVSSRSSSILNQGRRIPSWGERNITGKLVLD